MKEDRESLQIVAEIASIPWGPYLLFIVLVLLMITAIGYSYRAGDRVTTRYAPLVDAAMEIKLEAALGHLWFEEVISGDDSADVDAARAHLRQSEWYARAMLEGGENEEGIFVPLANDDLRQELREVLAKLQKYRAEAEQRYASMNAGIGSVSDQQFDKLFEDFIAQTDRVETTLQHLMATDVSRFRLTHLALFGIIVGLAIVSAYALHRFDRGRAADLVAIANARRVAELKEGNLAITLDSIGDAVIVTDIEGAISRMNPVAEALTGWRFADARGCPVSDVFRIVNSETRSTVEDPVGRVLREGKIVGLANHTSLIAADGTERQIADSGAPVRDRDGVLVGVVLVFRDVSEAYAKERLLRESESRFQMLFEQAPLGYQSLDPNGCLLAVNEAWLDQLGYSKEQVLGRSFGDFLAPEYRERFRENFPRFKAAGRIRGIEFEMIRNNGTRCLMSIDGDVGRNEQGEFKQSHCVLRDITEQKAAEEESRRLRRLLSNIIDSMPSMLMTVDAEGRVTHCNRCAQTIGNMSSEAIEGALLENIFPVMQARISMVKEAIREKTVHTAERVEVLVDGEHRFSNIVVYPLVANGVEGAVIRVDDVTDRVRIEEMMIQTEKMMSVGGLAAGMAHEINNPLAGMIQAAQNIERRLTEDSPANNEVAAQCATSLEAIRSYMQRRSVLEFLQGIRDCGVRAANIVSDMLQFSRKSDAKLTPMAIDKLIDRSVELAGQDYDLKKKYDFRHIEIVREYDSSVPHVPVIENEMQQVILNLLMNAAQAMQYNPEHRTPRFALRTSLDGSMVRIDVEDNGPGMEESIRRRVFEPFFTTKEAGVGTGLGLSVSYMIVTQNHGGEMSVESAPGEGTTFHIRLPLEHSSVLAEV